MKSRKQYILAFIIGVIISSLGISVFAADNLDWTNATQTELGKSSKWTQWCEQWEIIKNFPTQMSLSPGEDETKLNFAWYSNNSDIKPKLKISDNKNMENAKALTVKTTNATEGFKSNKATAKHLKPNMKYYYSYTINGRWVDPILYKTKGKKTYSFGFVGDPQIGSSWRNMPKYLNEEEIQNRAVRNDSFNWNNTINNMIVRNPNISFIVSAGDQIQSSDKSKPSLYYNKNEVEYAGYLSPALLKSIPVATTIGNHDSPSRNYFYHFNTPNESTLGLTMAGGDYYYKYGNTLFIVLNSNSTNIKDHKKFIQKVVEDNKDVKWRIVTMHHDIYGSGQHSSEPEVVMLRYQLAPIFEKNNIDVVLTGHDHIYSRSYILKGGKLNKSAMISDDEYEEYATGKKQINKKYKKYLRSIEDDYAVESKCSKIVKNPNGILYITANSASGSKYYKLSNKQQAYISYRWQENVPTYSIIDVTDNIFTINTYRTDNNHKIDSTFTIKKTYKN